MAETPPRLALLSVTDKTGLVDFARGLAERGFRLLSSGGTAAVLREAGLEVTGVDEHTGSPEILGGRVKTLHPRVHGGILARDTAEDRADLERRDIPAIDLVVVNLYRFEEQLAALPEDVAQGAGDLEHPAVQELIEKIDIGGPTLLRAAAKSAPRVGVVVDPADYARVLQALSAADGWTLALRAELAAKAFQRVTAYDQAIDGFFRRFRAPGPEGGLASDAGALLHGDLPRSLSSVGDGDARLRRLRYGENPHQEALAVQARDPGEACVLHAELRSGKPLSYNNLLDAEAALELVKEFAQPAAVVIKHTNPCGAAQGETPLDAFRRAYAGDPLSAFGGILALNRPVDEELARTISVRDHFFEVLVAPEVPDAALALLREGAPWGRNLRVLACGDTARDGGARPRWTARTVVGGVLVQQRDLADTWQADAVSHRPPTEAEEADLRLAWKVVRHVRSNAIVLVKDGALVGTGAGQMSRVDSVKIAVEKAGDRARGAVMASDAFFPFRDGVDAALAAGVTAVVQPGGSRRDQESVDAVDEAGAAMVFTGHRHFKH